jgi:hypothetical protein
MKMMIIEMQPPPSFLAPQAAINARNRFRMFLRRKIRSWVYSVRQRDVQ